MIVKLLLIIVPVLLIMALIARMSFELTKPAVALTGLGILGAVMFLVGLSTDQTGVEQLSTLATFGTIFSLIAFLGLLALILIWAIRRWGLPNRPEERR